MVKCKVNSRTKKTAMKKVNVAVVQQKTPLNNDSILVWSEELNKLVRVKISAFPYLFYQRYAWYTSTAGVRALDINTGINANNSNMFFCEIKVHGYIYFRPNVIYLQGYAFNNSVIAFYGTKTGPTAFEIGWSVDANNIIHLYLQGNYNLTAFWVSLNNPISGLSFITEIPGTNKVTI